jgi:N-acetylglucosaminyl-diphospho-decaprenol L-rhamnosyltransferase
VICVSLVSHGHGTMVEGLVSRLLSYPEVTRIIITLNIVENIILPECSRVYIVKNKLAKGFGENHNSAFARSSEQFFCVLNPDVELPVNPFPGLLTYISNQQVGLVAPFVKSSAGLQEDSWRRFPTVFSLIKKIITNDCGMYSIPADGSAFSPDWCAGMFMLFRRKSFEQIGGFDEKFYLYYEDVDICLRLRKQNINILACPTVTIVHDSQRDSHRKLLYFYYHLRSVVRYLIKHRRIW